ncbi:MAG: NmrA family NAD(P)-binding protein [Ignavibacteriales bacterium]|nr:NmrA family NAD(P)-binding protein [Ignavibacteriales bacterium]
MKTSDKERVILVTGATGQQGGAVARHLLKDGWKVRALVRDPNKEPAQTLTTDGAELVKGDLYHRPSIDAALKGVYGVFSVQNFWLPDVGYEGEIKQGILLADAAKAAGVKHFIYSSVGAAHRGMGQKHFESKWKIEQHIQKLGLPHTILRPVAFMENYNRFRELISNGVFQSWGLQPDKTMQLIAVEDIGAFVSILFDKPDEFPGKTIEFAGDELTETQIAQTLSKVIGRPVKIQPAQMAEGQQPTPEQTAMLQFFNGKAYDADIAAIRTMYPGLRTFEQYLRESGWLNLPVTPVPEGDGWRR